MTDLTTFEQRLGERLERELDRGDLSFDADRVAAAAMVQRTPFDRVLNRLAIGPLPLGSTGRKAVLLAVTAVLTLATLALAVGIVSRDGSRLAVIRWNGDVVVARGDGSEQAVLLRVAEDPRMFTSLAWAPGGEYLAVVEETLQFSIISRTGDVVYTRTVEPSRGRFAWSPDGKRLAIFDGPWAPPEEQDVSGVMILPRLEIVGLDGEVETMPLPPDFWFDIGRGYVAWSPDGRSIVVTGTVDRHPLEYTPSSLWIVDTVDRTVRELPSGDPFRAVTYDLLPAWLPDGRLVYSSFNSGVRLIDPRNGESTTIYEIDLRDCPTTCAPFVSALEVSPDGTRLAFFDPGKGYSILDLATGTSVEVPFPESGHFPHPLFGHDSTAEWTRDGRGLVGVFYTGTTRETLEVSVATVDIGTGAVHELVADARTFDYVP